MLKEITKDGIFGRVDAYIYVIEFQKRGLPHMHLLVHLADEDQIRQIEDIDKIVCAELPDPVVDPALYKTVKSSMVHGPCGEINPYSPCMEDRECTKGYPKKFKLETKKNVDGYPIYRRRNNGNSFETRGIEVDNRWIVPYNPYLTKRYDAHINVEICSSIKSIKYLFKYVYKGHDCANVELKQDEPNVLHWDEITTFLDARYVSVPEAMWRLLEKRMHEKSHTVFRLAVHLENLQPVYFLKNVEQVALDKARTKKSHLLAWLELNKASSTAHGVLYPDIPKAYTFSQNAWKARCQVSKGERVISRMYSVSPKDIERFHLRMLLNHVPGACSFEDLRTFDGVIYETFKEACRARQLLRG